MRETNRPATLVRQLRNAQVVAATDAIRGENLMGIDQRGVDRVWLLVEAG